MCWSIDPSSKWSETLYRSYFPSPDVSEATMQTLFGFVVWKISSGHAGRPEGQRNSSYEIPSMPHAEPNHHHGLQRVFASVAQGSIAVFNLMHCSPQARIGRQNYQIIKAGDPKLLNSLARANLGHQNVEIPGGLGLSWESATIDVLG